MRAREAIVDRGTFVLAVLSAAGEGAAFSPVQVQKLFFIIDREAADLVGGPRFNFQPFDYGPFDSQVYVELDKLGARGLVQIYHTGRYRIYSLSHEGYRQGYTALKTLPGPAVTYIREVAIWVRQLNFQQLVAAIYRRYPEMRANSIFNQ